MPDTRMRSLPDEVRIANAQSDLFNALAAILDGHDLPTSMASLLLKAVLLQIADGEIKTVSRFTASALVKPEPEESEE